MFIRTVAAAALFAMGAVQAEPLKIATWNIQNLRNANYEGPNSRERLDFQRLAGYAEQLGADVIALQEIENDAAMARVFPPLKYRLVISERDAKQRTGFAVRVGIGVERHPDLKGLDVSGELRHGVDITITKRGRSMRLLSVHLKSGCESSSLSGTGLPEDCTLLNRQLPKLEAWIDARAREDLPFAVLGDFNRELNAPDDQFWAAIDDGVPDEADLVSATAGQQSACWGTESPQFLDHLVLDRRAGAMMQAESFEQLVYTEGLRDKRRLSDRCPVAVTLNLAANEPAEETRASVQERAERAPVRRLPEATATVPAQAPSVSCTSTGQAPAAQICTVILPSGTECVSIHAEGGSAITCP